MLKHNVSVRELVMAVILLSGAKKKKSKRCALFLYKTKPRLGGGRVTNGDVGQGPGLLWFINPDVTLGSLIARKTASSPSSTYIFGQYTYHNVHCSRERLFFWSCTSEVTWQIILLTTAALLKMTGRRLILFWTRSPLPSPKSSELLRFKDPSWAQLKSIVLKLTGIQLESCYTRQ